MPKTRASIEVLILAVLIGIFAGRAVVPAWRTLNTDFPNYYVAARLYSQGHSLARIYDWIWFQRQKDHMGIEKRVVVFVPHTLYSAMPIVPLSSMPPLQAKRYWTVINLILLAISALFLRSMTQLGGKRIAILVLLAIEPLRTQFVYGQLHIVVLVFIVFALWLYLRDWPISAGAMLALASAVKIYPILFVFYFVRKKQWRVIGGLAGCCVLLAVAAIGLFGMEVNRVYVEQILPRIVRGEAFDPYSLAWNSFSALFRRLFIFEPQLNPHPLIDMPLGYAALQPLAQALLLAPLFWLLTPNRASVETEKLEYGAYVAALLVLSTNPASYHYVVLIVCAVLVVDELLRRQRTVQIALFLLLYIAACLPTHRAGEAASAAAILVSSGRLVFTLGLFIFLLAVLTSLSAETWRQRFQSRHALVFLLMVAMIGSVAAFESFRHIAGEMNYTARIATEPESLLMTDPSPSEERIAFTKLKLPGYTVGVLAEKRLSSLASDGDLFHPAVIPHSSQALAELAGATSRIVRIELDEQAPSDETLPIEVEDGEQPALSADGHWLAFIREVRGRGSLWIRRLESGQAAESGASDERRLVGPDYDVLEAVFDTAGAQIVFAAQPRGQPAIFAIDRDSSVIKQITFDIASRYPAISGDGLWLAYSKLVSGNWQIWLQPRHSGSNERQLTTGDCNAVSPAWMPDSKELIYATDCGRGVGMTALNRIRAVR